MNHKLTNVLNNKRIIKICLITRGETMAKRRKKAKKKTKNKKKAKKRRKR